MYTLAMKDGDWDFTDRHGKVATGNNKLVQQLSNWVQEELGLDRFHPSYGSGLQTMVGKPKLEETQAAVEQELMRVCTSYMDYQAQLFDKSPGDWSKDEVIAAVLFVSSYWVGQELHATVYVRTMDGQTRDVDMEVM